MFGPQERFNMAFVGNRRFQGLDALGGSVKRRELSLTFRYRNGEPNFIKGLAAGLQ